MADRVTLQTLADRLGVSRSTVSNAFNRPDQLSDELRTRILDAASALGYAGPDPAARSLRRGRSGAIGLVQMLRYAVTDAANRLLLDGVAEVCEQEGLALVLIPTRAPDEGRPDVLRTALVDGVIVHGDSVDDARRRLVAERGLPLVTLDTPAGPDELSVGIDDQAGSALAVEHIIELGHRRIAILTIAEQHSIRMIASMRLEGYERALRAAGIDVAAVPVVHGGGLELDAFNARVRTLLERPDRPTAILAMSDEVAAGAVRVAQTMGLRVPADLSVTGFDDSATAFSVDPPLTTIRQDFRAKGRIAVRMALGDTSHGRHVVLPVELIVRGSTGPAPAG